MKCLFSIPLLALASPLASCLEANPEARNQPNILLVMLVESGVDVLLNTFLADAARDGQRIVAAIGESRSGREAYRAQCFVDCTGIGDLAARAGADFSDPNDYAVANSMGVGGVKVEKFYQWLKETGALYEYCEGTRSGQPDKIVRVSGHKRLLPEEFRTEANKVGMAIVTTTVHDDYFMFIKINMKMAESPTSRDAVVKADLELRQALERGGVYFETSSS